MRVDVQMRNNAITIQGLRVYLAEKYGIRKGNRIKYIERGEEKVEHIYEVDAIYPHCVLLRDIFDNTRICPCYGKKNILSWLIVLNVSPDRKMLQAESVKRA